VSSKNTSVNLIANRYASALYDLASDSKCIEEVLKNLEFINTVFENNKDFKLLIKSPLINSSDKLIILEKITSKNSIHNLTLKFIKLLSTNKRINILNLIILEFNKINSQKRGDVLANITSADVLNNNQKDEINNKLKKLFGDKLSLNFNTDKNIIGGLIIKVGSKMIDTSISSKINNLEIAMRGN
tara:strand:+ start:17967 stop:18524 length:558 start_codon:yes stop_codon:yes gene_type:complete